MALSARQDAQNEFILICEAKVQCAPLLIYINFLGM